MLTPSEHLLRDGHLEHVAGEGHSGLTVVDAGGSLEYLDYSSVAEDFQDLRIARAEIVRRTKDACRYDASWKNATCRRVRPSVTHQGFLLQPLRRQYLPGEVHSCHALDQEHRKHCSRRRTVCTPTLLCNRDGGTNWHEWQGQLISRAFPDAASWRKAVTEVVVTADRKCSSEARGEDISFFSSYSLRYLSLPIFPSPLCPSPSLPSRRLLLFYIRNTCVYNRHFSTTGLRLLSQPSGSCRCSLTSGWMMSICAVSTHMQEAEGGQRLSVRITTAKLQRKKQLVVEPRDFSCPVQLSET